MSSVPGMPQTKAAQDMLYALEFVKHHDILDVQDAAEELARQEGATRLDVQHIQRALTRLSGQEVGHA